MNNNPHQGLHNLYLFLGIVVACIVIWQFIAQFVVPRLSTQVSTVASSNQGFTNTPYGKGACVTVTTQNNESAVVTGDVKINGNQYYTSTPTIGTLDIIGSNETVNVCGDFGFNLQTPIPNSQLQSVVSDDTNYMEHTSGCGSTCSSVTTNNV